MGGQPRSRAEKSPLALQKREKMQRGLSNRDRVCVTNYANTYTSLPYKFIRWVLKTKYATFTNVSLGPNGPQGPWGAALAGVSVKEEDSPVPRLPLPPVLPQSGSSPNSLP